MCTKGNFYYYVVTGVILSSNNFYFNAGSSQYIQFLWRMYHILQKADVHTAFSESAISNMLGKGIHNTIS